MKSIMRSNLVLTYKQEWDFHSYIYGMEVVIFKQHQHAFKVNVYSKRKSKSGYFEHSFFYLPFCDSYKIHGEIEEFCVNCTENGILAKELIYILMDFYKRCEIKFMGV